MEFFKLEHYENDTEISKEYWTKNHPTNHLEKSEEMCFVQPNQKKNIICVLMKSLKSLHRKNAIY